MARLRNTQTGSVVNIPDEKVAGVMAVGYYEAVDGEKKQQPAKRAAAKKKQQPAKRAAAKKTAAKPSGD